MWVSHLRLTDFRSYESVDLTLDQGTTAFLGANGQGKTNLVEAIGFTSVLGSHRVSTDAPLVRAGAERAVIGVTAQRGDRTAVIELEINPGKANRARVNRGATTRARDVLGIVTTVLFAPEDLALVKGDPSDRRRFIDELMIQRTPRIQGVKADYERILKQRNALLKSVQGARRGTMEHFESTMDVWDEQLVALGSEIIVARTTVLAAMEPHLTRWYAQIAGGDDAVSPADLKVSYASGMSSDPGEDAGIDDWRGALREEIAARRKDETDRGITLVGPHRHDLALALGELPAKGYASHGESWSVALSLRLASFEVLSEDGEQPILILDDVFAELDAARRDRLADAIAGCEQVLITAAVAEDVPVPIQGSTITVQRGRVSR